MKRDLVPLLLVLAVVGILLPLFAWIQSQVGYQTFATGGLVIVSATTIICVLWTAVSLRRRNKGEQ